MSTRWLGLTRPDIRADSAVSLPGSPCFVTTEASGLRYDVAVGTSVATVAILEAVS